ncbi:MAG: hypothetical protein M3Q10_13020 [Chloroflexota bacterium]|nr:hypothetical protein [Chloroflexota bacterium]
MPRVLLVPMVFALAAVTAATTLRAAAQNPGPAVTPLAAASSHPIVGSWSETRNDGAHITFFADGNVILTDGDGQTWHGAWQPAGADGPVATYVVQSWGSGGGQGFEDQVFSVSSDELTLGYGTFWRLVAPDPTGFASGVATPASGAVPSESGGNTNRAATA